MGSVKGQASGSWAMMEHVAATHTPIIGGAELVQYTGAYDLWLSVGLEDKAFN